MIHLDLTTDYSFLRGYMTPDQGIKRAQKLKARGLGIADYCSTWGHVPFMRAAQKAGMELALGVTLPVVRDLDKRPVHDLAAVFPRDRASLESLYELVGVASEQQYYRPRVTWEQIARGGFNIISYVCEPESVPDALEAGARFALRPTDSLQQRAIRNRELPWVLAPKACMAEARHKPGYDAMQRASDLARIGEAMKQLDPIHMTRRGELMAELGLTDEQFDDAYSVTEEIFDDAAAATREFGSASLPDVPEGWDLRRAVADGAARRGIQLEGPYADRVERELGVIADKGFEPYFHFVGEICQWARGRMLVGPGRGSAGGCLVAYLLGITNVDPLVHGTLFERFIDPTRSDMPDIDVDFQDNRREMVFDELRRVYGDRRVARIGTVSMLGGRSALNEVTRFERHVPFAARDALAQLSDGANVPLGVMFNVGLTDDAERVLAEYPELRAAALLDGHARHHGVHAAGVCVAAEPVTRFASVDKNGVASLTLDDAESVGLLKFDALGLTTLSVIDEACAEAGIDPYDLERLDLADPKVYEVFEKDNVVGVFQFEGHTVRGLMREVKVDRFSDLCALSSLARPGPLQGGAAAAWVKRRMGLEDWSYDHPLLEPITRETYGLIVYQEQMMRIGRDLAGFDDGQVNRMRKAVGKKKPEELAAMEAGFLEGASPTVGSIFAAELWSRICDFGGYAFNLSHAVAYSMVSYYCAWLKAYHPQQFAIGLLRHCADDDRAKLVLRELLKEGVPFVPFDPQQSELTWTVKDGVLYGGFTGVHGVGTKKATTFIEKREADPEGWLEKLTPAQRSLLLYGETPWASIDEIGKKFGWMFDAPLPLRVENEGGKVVIKHPLYRIADIPHRKGTYTAVAKIKKLVKKDQNDKDRVTKRGGRKVSGPTAFLNVILEDDGVEMGSTINRFKFEDMGQGLLDDPTAVGGFYLVRGDILGGDGPKWLLLDRLFRLDVPSTSHSEQEQP